LVIINSTRSVTILAINLTATVALQLLIILIQTGVNHNW